MTHFWFHALKQQCRTISLGPKLNCKKIAKYVMASHKQFSRLSENVIHASVLKTFVQCRGGNESVAGFGSPRFHDCFTAKFYDVRR